MFISQGVSPQQFQAANGTPVENGSGGTSQNVQPCPFRNEGQALEVAIGYENEGKLVLIADLEIELAPTDLVTAVKTSNQFCAVRFEGLANQSYGLTVRNLDSPLWEMKASEPLLNGRETGKEAPQWSKRPDTLTQGKIVEVPEGMGLDKLALRNGHLAETVWKRDENQHLHKDRQSWNVLKPGDPVFLPPLTWKVAKVQPGYLYVLIVRIPPARFRLRLMNGMAPIRNTDCVLELGKMPAKPCNTGDGVIDLPAPWDATEAKVTFLDPPLTIVVKMDTLLPIAEPAGFEQRLRNLGYLLTNLSDPNAPDILRRVQASFGQEPTGAVTPELMKAVWAVHDR